MIPQLVTDKCPYDAATLLDLLKRVKCAEEAVQGLSRKTGEDLRRLGQTEGAESLKELRPLCSTTLATR